MESRESFREVENLRFRFQMNNRLRLECLAAVSRVFREFSEPITDELLAGIVFALPQELVSGNGHTYGKAEVAAAPPKGQYGQPPEGPQPGLPPEGPQPGLPPEGPKPGLPPEGPKPGLPPEGPKPGLPPEGPKAGSSTGTTLGENVRLVG